MNARLPMILMCLGLARCGHESIAPPIAGTPTDSSQPAPAEPTVTAAPAAPSLAGLELRLSVEGGTVAAVGEGEPIILTAALCGRGGATADRMLAGDLQARGMLEIAQLADGSVRACPIAVETLPVSEPGTASFAIKPERTKGARDLTLVAMCETSGEKLASNPIQVSFTAAWGSENAGASGLARLIRYRIARGELDDARTALVKLAALPGKREQALGLAATLFAAGGKNTNAEEAERMLLLAVAERASKRDPPCDHQLELPLLSPRRPAAETPSDPLLSQLSR
jgi:hypothetical protein